ncbi:hypothetical protein FA95DRAFT_1612141 [Auriscalpium vulgare]|uniref:Uncharacterized protein n=1 Tax=Auriscalpium vulgare TaxID=40419 RepID=A0ACB8R8W0_9AGAM|nr:hypothetical protein FA95DRAFT_1612141 [Auriscalpium vulgare]
MSSGPPPNGPPGLSTTPNIARAGKGRRYAFYVVVNGEFVGVFSDWLVAAPLITGWPGAQFRGFHLFEEAASAYHTAMSALTVAPSEHPSSLVFHFANPAGDALSVEDSHAAAHGAALPSIPATVPSSPNFGSSALPPSAAPASAAAPAQPAAASSSVVSSQFPGTVSQASTSAKSRGKVARPPSQDELNALMDVMQSLELDDLLKYLIGRRNPPLCDEPSEDQPVVMTVALLRDEARDGASGYRVVTRTYTPPVDDQEADTYSTAPPSLSPSHASLATDTGSMSVVSTPSASPSLSSMTRTSCESLSSADQRAAITLNLPFGTEARSATPTGALRSAVNVASSSVDRTPRSSVAPAGATPSGQEDGDKWYVVLRGHMMGIFRGPIHNICTFIVNYPGAHFVGFSTRAAAVAWFAEQDEEGGE